MDAILREIRDCRATLESIYKVKTDGCMVRARANWMEYGERNSKYFISLEKRNQKQKVITRLHSHTGQIITKSKDILDEEKYFYQQLYSSSNPPNFNIDVIFQELKLILFSLRMLRIAVKE